MQHTVRYFVNSYNEGDTGEDTDILTEVSEREFITAEGEITYERHTMSENGVSQICLTKGLDVC
jgi:hypothetical protein